MPHTNRLRFFNYFRNLVRQLRLDFLLVPLTKGKGYDNFFVKCLPQNYQYPAGSFRKVQRNGIHYRLDLSEYMEWVIYFGLTVEHRESLYPLIKESMVILDIGSYIGETLLNFARLTGRTGKVIGFEPTEHYNKSVINIALNSFENVTINNIALSDKEETLYFNPASDKNNSGVFMSRIQEVNKYTVNAMPLDRYLETASIQKVDLMKIDVEGFETNIIKGAINSIMKFKPILFVEVNDHNLQRQGSSAAALQALIHSLNYEIEPAGQINTTGTGPHFDIICRPLN